MSKRDPLFGERVAPRTGEERAGRAWWSSWRVMGGVGVLALVALVLAALFAGQLLSPSSAVRWTFTGIYLVASIGLLTLGPKRQRDAFLQLLLPRWGGSERAT